MGMTHRDVRDAYDYNSGRASDIARQLGFAGLAIVWLFKTGGGRVPPGLVLPAVLIVMTLALDLLQYVAGTVVWGVYNRWHDREGTDRDAEFLAPRWLNWPALTFFWLKLLGIAAAYVFLLAELAGRLGF